MIEKGDKCKEPVISQLYTDFILVKELGLSPAQIDEMDEEHYQYFIQFINSHNKAQEKANKR